MAIINVTPFPGTTSGSGCPFYFTKVIFSLPVFPRGTSTSDILFDLKWNLIDLFRVRISSSSWTSLHSSSFAPCLWKIRIVIIWCVCVIFPVDPESATSIASIVGTGERTANTAWWWSWWQIVFWHISFHSLTHFDSPSTPQSVRHSRLTMFELSPWLSLADWLGLPISRCRVYIEAHRHNPISLIQSSVAQFLSSFDPVNYSLTKSDTRMNSYLANLNSICNAHGLAPLKLEGGGWQARRWRWVDGMEQDDARDLPNSL